MLKNHKIRIITMTAAVTATMAAASMASAADTHNRRAGGATETHNAVAAPRPATEAVLFRRQAAPFGFIGKSVARATALPPAERASDAAAVTESQLFAMMGNASMSEYAYDTQGIYRLSTTSTEGYDLAHNINGMYLPNCMGAVYAGDRYFYAEAQQISGYVFGMTYHLYNTSSWTEISSNSNGDTNFQAQDMTYDPATGNVYGFFVNSQKHSSFGTLDINTGAITEIADFGTTAMRAIAATEGGTLYTIGADGVLYTIDKTSGDLTRKGATGLHSTYITTGAIDPRSNIFYYATCSDEEQALYAIDLATAQPAKLYDFTEIATSLAGMYVIAPAAEPKAPGAVQKLQLEFAGSSLTGAVKFTTPATHFDDSMPDDGEEIRYTVTANGKEILSDVTEYGIRVAKKFSVENPGEYTIGVRVCNSVGQSPLETVTQWIGSATPAPLKNVRLTLSDGRFNLTWDAPEPLAGGDFNPDAVTFNVVRHPGAAPVATGISSRNFSEQAPAPESLTEYSFEVTAIYEGVRSQPVFSNRIAIGDIIPPFTDSFDVPSSLDKYTAINANRDDITWRWDETEGNGCAVIDYNGSMAMNDWLILPAAQLKGGIKYQLLFDAWVLATTSRHCEKLEVFIGNAPTADAMTQTIIPLTELRNTAPEETKEFFSVAADGKYYIGFHGCSDRDMYRLHIDNLRIADPIAASAPGAPTGLTVTPAADGSLKATINFTAPAIDLDGNPLKELSGVRIYRGDEQIGETHPGVGRQSEPFTDTNAAEGINTYRLVPYNASGSGREATVSGYIGIAAPLAVSTVSGQLGADDGEVKLTWTPVTSDVNGFALTSDMVTYNINRYQNGEMTPIAKGHKGTTFTHRVCSPDDEQAFTYYTVSAVTAGDKTAAATGSNMIAVGAPYEAHFAESFANGGANSIWYNMAPAYPMNGSWVGTTHEISTGYGITSHDGDNGLLLFGGPFTGCEAYIFSGRIALIGIANPALTFRYFDDGSGNMLDVVVMTDMATPVVEQQITMSATDQDKQGWEKATVSLAKYAGRTIQVGFRGEISTSRVIAVDNVRIVSDTDHNLTAMALAVPATVKPATTFTLSVDVLNTGRLAADGYTVELYRDDELIGTLPGNAVEPDGIATITFSDILSPATDAEVRYHASAAYAADGDKADNSTDPTKVKVMHNAYPAVTDLTGTQNGGTVTLSWSEPDWSGTAIPVTDDVETLAPFSIGLTPTEAEGDNVGDWTMIDVDKSLTYGIDAGTGDDEWVKYPNARKEMAFQVFNAELAGVRGWDAYSGKQMFACFAATVPANDDWLVSPELTGGEQTVSFMARAVTPQYPERFEFLYSTTGKAVADFRLVEKVDIATSVWTEYRYNLPEGAKYFAIRCTSDNAFALLIDYITYVGLKGLDGELALVGYNIYRDGVKLNPEPVMEPTYPDTEPTSPEAKYRVTTVYNLGESAPSNIYTPSGSGLDTTDADSAISITAARGTIMIKGAAGHDASVYTPDGRTAATARCASATGIHVAPGIYMVQVAGRTAKLHVR